MINNRPVKKFVYKVAPRPKTIRTPAPEIPWIIRYKVPIGLLFGLMALPLMLHIVISIESIPNGILLIFFTLTMSLIYFILLYVYSNSLSCYNKKKEIEQAIKDYVNGAK